MKAYFKLHIFISFFFIGYLNLASQKIELKINSKDSINASLLNTLEFRHFHTNQKSIYKEIDSITTQLHFLGFINSYLNSLTKKDAIYTATYNIGVNKKFIYIYFDAKKINKKIFSSFTTDITNNYIKINTYKVPLVLQKIVDFYEYEGNSFVEASLKDMKQLKDTLFANLHIVKTSKRKIDSVVIKGYSNFPKSFVKHYLNLKKESVFNTDKLKIVSSNVKNLQFVTETKPPEVLFTKDSTTVYIYLKKKKTNTFNGLLGFSSNEDRKLVFNGFLDLVLSNIFDKGENLALYWKSNGNDRKFFNLSVKTPYLFKSPISSKISFNIHKQDSAFLNVRSSINILHNINHKNTIAAKFLNEKSNNLKQNTTDIKGFKNAFYGLSYSYSNNDYNLSKNKFLIMLDVFWGNRTLNETSAKDFQQKYEVTFTYNWNLNYKNAILIKNNSGIFISDTYYTNEIYRLGGVNSIRGFNEESIFATTYTVLNLEYRYLLENQSHLYSITDIGYIQNKTNNNNVQLYSFGLGYQYKVNTSLIDISYALGKVSKLPFNLENSKFHIKLIQLF